MKHPILSVVIVLTIAVAVGAAGRSIMLPSDNPYGALKPGPDVEMVRNRCAICHSTDYVVMQPRGDARQWQAVVTKMIKVFGSPISDEESKAIVEYLASHYGHPK